MATFCPTLTLTFPSAISSCHLQLPPEGVTPSHSRSALSEWELQQGQGIRSLTKKNESKVISYRQNLLMTLVINLSRAYKLSSPPQFQGDTLSQPSSSDLKFLTLASYSRLSNTDLKINTHRPLPSPPRLCPGKHPSPQLWALNTSNHSQVPCALPYKKPSEPAPPLPLPALLPPLL